MICDLAETYHIYDYRGLPVQTLATLVCGLRSNSRVKMKMSGMTIDMNTLLLASITDRTGLLVWAQTKDGRDGINRPKSIVESLLHPDGEAQPDNEIMTFSSIEDFEQTRKNILYGKED